MSGALYGSGAGAVAALLVCEGMSGGRCADVGGGVAAAAFDLHQGHVLYAVPRETEDGYDATRWAVWTEEPNGSPYDDGALAGSDPQAVADEIASYIVRWHEDDAEPQS